MNKYKNVTQYLVTTPNTVNVKETITFVKNINRNARQIQTLNAPTVFTTDKALANLVTQYGNKGFIIVEKNGLSTVAIKLATDTKIPFGLIVRTGNTPKITYINKVNINNNVKTTTKVAVGTVNN